MIISHKYKFVFIRPMKVGGTSTEVKLVEILRQHSRKDEIISQPPHMGVTQVLKAYGNDVADYTFFSVCRNPWDRAVSMFFHRHRELAQEDFQRQQKVFQNWIKSGDYLFDKRGSIFDVTGSPFWRGVPMVDHVIRYDYLAKGLREMSRRLELPELIDVTNIRERGQDRPKSARDFASFYDADSWKAIAMAAARDCVAFGYSAETPQGGDDAIIDFACRDLREKAIGELSLKQALKQL